MTKYRVKNQYWDMWAVSNADEAIVDMPEIERLADEWETTVDELLEQCEEDYTMADMMKDYHRCETPNGEWDMDMCRELCEDAGMLEEWEAADGETFEQVIFKAAKKLGINLFD